MKESIIDKVLSTTGYLPPRNEEEMTAFEKIYSKVEIDENFHVNVDSIANGGCRVRPQVRSIGNGTTTANDMRMAARNFEAMPKDVIDKIRKQHKGGDD